MSAVIFKPPQSTQGFLASEKFISLVVGPVGCLHGDTLVLTEDGPIPIADIDQPRRVLSWDDRSGQYRLAQASVAFPKGMDYLYRVVTPQGEFDASGLHQLLCADGVYRRVCDLKVGDSLAGCSPSLPASSSGNGRLGLLSGAPRCSRIDEGSRDGYVALDRLHGLLSLCLQAGVLTFAPSRSDVQACNLQFARGDFLRSDALRVELVARTLAALNAAQKRTGGYVQPGLLRSEAEEDRVLEALSVCGANACQEFPQFQSTYEPHQQVHGPVVEAPDLLSPLKSPEWTTTERPIVSITRKNVKEIYWDLQVDGTHNYVTDDGAVHHNSTKTSVGIMKIAYHAKKMAPCIDGVRRSRCVWVRNTNQMLHDTSIPDFLKWFPDGVAGVLEKTKMKFVLQFDDVVCEVLFRGLEDANDVRRLLSLQISFAVLDEFREIHPDIYDALQGRLGRYPDTMMVPPKPEWGVDDKGNPIGGCVRDDGVSNKLLWGMTNPPDADTFWETLLTTPPSNVATFFQPSGLSQEADWIQYLPSGYYDNLAEGKSQDWVDVYIHAKFGKSLSGKPVFSSFKRELHVANNPLIVLSSPLIIGVDAGLTPTATVCQADFQGRLLVHDCITGDSMGALRFIREMLKPLITRKFPGLAYLIVIDPAAFQRAQTDERTVADMYKNEGFRVVGGRTNTITARLASVESYLNRLVDGKSGLLIDPGCLQLIEALRSKYRYRITAKGDREEAPEKSHPWSDLADSLQYACMHADNGAAIGARGLTSSRREIKYTNYAYI